ncbi:hypothetical protein D3C86_1856440 [compost metagenome]
MRNEIAVYSDDRQDDQDAENEGRDSFDHLVARPNSESGQRMCVAGLGSTKDSMQIRNREHTGVCSVSSS